MKEVRTMQEFNELKGALAVNAWARTMQEFNAVKEMVMDTWVEVHMEAIAHGDGEAEAFLDSLRDQISGYEDMSAEDMTDEVAAALGLTLPLDDDTMDAWQTFINQCAKEY